MQKIFEFKNWRAGRSRPRLMMLAGELAGVWMALVERRATQALAGSRAGGLHARTLEVLDQRGIAERFVAAGQTTPFLDLPVTILRSCEVTGFTEDAGGVTVALSSGGPLQARHLVGCDGGRSVVR